MTFRRVLLHEKIYHYFEQSHLRTVIYEQNSAVISTLHGHIHNAENNQAKVGRVTKLPEPRTRQNGDDVDGQLQNSMRFCAPQC